MTPAVLRALAGKVERGDGPDREMDGRVWRTLEPSYADRIVSRAVRADPDGYITRAAASWRNAPAYTSSVDAAAAVMPEGWAYCGVTAISERGLHAEAMDPDAPQRVLATAAAEVLARLACGLRARAAMMEREQETTP